MTLDSGSKIDRPCLRLHSIFILQSILLVSTVDQRTVPPRDILQPVSLFLDFKHLISQPDVGFPVHFKPISWLSNLVLRSLQATVGGFGRRCLGTTPKKAAALTVRNSSSLETVLNGKSSRARYRDSWDLKRLSNPRPIMYQSLIEASPLHLTLTQGVAGYLINAVKQFTPVSLLGKPFGYLVG